MHIERLRKAYGAGATPLREALSKLSSLDLVTTEGQRGSRGDADAGVAHTVDDFIETKCAILIGELKSRHTVEHIIAALHDEIRSGMGRRRDKPEPTPTGPRRESRKK